jgi:hypothetical protein
MKALLQQLHAVTSLELVRVARARATPIAICAFVTLLVLGQWLHSRALPPRPDDDRLFGYAFLGAIMLGLRFGFSGDRKHGTEPLLLGNLIRPAALYLGKVLALTITMLLFVAIALLSAAIVTKGDWEFTLWYTLLMALAVWSFTPLILVIELLMETRSPGLAAFARFALLSLVAALSVGPGRFTELMGFDIQRFSYPTLQPLALRALLATMALALLYPAWRKRAGPI